MSYYENKKLLILGGTYLHNKVVEAARAMGIYTIVVDNIIGAPAKALANKYYDIDVSNVDELERLCKEECVDAIINVCLDFCQVYYQQLCERLGLPCYGSYEQFQYFTNKELFKQLCIDNGVSIIPSYTEENVFYNNPIVEYPILVKPGKGSGSKGQYVCDNNEEARLAVKSAQKYSETGHAVIEKYMGGKEDFQVTYLVIDSVPYVVRTADRYLGAKEEKMDRVAIALSSPSYNTDIYFQKVHENVCKMFKKIGIKNAPVFMQGFVDGETIRFYDPGLRFPGGDYDRVFASIMNIDLMKMLIELSFTGKIDNSAKKHIDDKTVRLNGNTIFTLHSTVRSGVIEAITNLDEILAIKGVEYVSLRHGIGDKIEFTGNVNQRIAEINIYAPNAQELKKTVQEVEDKFIVLDESGRDMIFCKFDVDTWRAYRG